MSTTTNVPVLTSDQELIRRVARELEAYDNFYEAEGADYTDYRKRNAGLDPNKSQLFYAPFATHATVDIHYDLVFASVPWRKIIPIVVYKETHKLPRAEMERRIADAESARDVRLYGEEEERRAQPCARCQQPIGGRAYVRHLGGLTRDRALQYIHFDCRKCASCGETITGEYVHVNVRQDTQPQAIGGGSRFYSMDGYTDKTYYHASCAYAAGVKPTNGGVRDKEYGFYTSTAEDDLINGGDK